LELYRYVSMRLHGVLTDCIIIIIIIIWTLSPNHAIYPFQARWQPRVPLP